MANRLPTEEFGRPDAKVDLRALDSVLGVMKILGKATVADPYYALDVAGYLLQRIPADLEKECLNAAKSEENEQSGSDTELESSEAALRIERAERKARALLRATCTLALHAVDATAWRDLIKEDVAEQWQDRLKEFNEPRSGDPKQEVCAQGLDSSV